MQHRGDPLLQPDLDDEARDVEREKPGGEDAVHLGALQAGEHRPGIAGALTDTIRIERVGMALFYEAGTAADSLDALPEARIHTSYGVELRVSLERTAVFRADVGFSREDVNVTVGFGLSF